MSRIGREIVRLDRCASTNDEAARLAARGAPHGTVVVADAQEAGRGRESRRWHSPPGKNLYFSLVLRPEKNVAPLPPLTLAAGIAVCDVARDAGAPAALKWPNDVLCGGKKVAGLLAEMQSRGAEVGHLILGIGVNVNSAPAEFPGELAPRVTSLRQEAGGAPFDREALLARLLEELDRWLGRFFGGGVAAIRDEWIARADLSLRLRARVAGREVEGRAAGLGEHGELLFEEEGGARHCLAAGEVEAILS